MQVIDKEFLGRKIKSFRKKRNMTQAELAEKVDISEKHISKIEAGIHQPSLMSFLKITQILNIGMEEFGLTLKAESNPIKEEIYRCINDSTAQELKIILPLIKCLKDNLK